MKVKLKKEQDRSSSAVPTEELIDLLIDARPDEILLAPDTADRIFENALRESTVSTEAPRMALAGTRLVLSAAFCICAAAGLLLIRSLASVRNAGSRGGTEHRIAFHAQSADHMAAIGACEPQVGAHQSSIKIASPAHNRDVTDRFAIASIDAQLTYAAPPAPVCGMTTFAIFTPVSVTAPRSNRDPAGYSEGGSLLVCVVNIDDPSDDKTTKSSSIDIENGPPTSSQEILVGAASCVADSRDRGVDAFVSGNAGSKLVLPMPDYIVI